MNKKRDEKEIKKYANRSSWSDTNPYEVVKIISEKTVVVRAMHTELVKSPSAVAGGFCAHFENQEQEWKISSDVDMPEERIRWSEAKQTWQSKHGSKFWMSDRPVKFFDFNF